MVRPRFEPTTSRTIVQCSTNWANGNSGISRISRQTECQACYPWVRFHQWHEYHFVHSRKTWKVRVRHFYDYANLPWSHLLVFAKFGTFQIIPDLPAFRSSVYKVHIKTFMVLYLALRNVITHYIMPYWNLHSLKFKAFKIFRTNSNATAINHTRFTKLSKLWKTMCFNYW